MKDCERLQHNFNEYAAHGWIEDVWDCKVQEHIIWYMYAFIYVCVYIYIFIYLFIFFIYMIPWKEQGTPWTNKNPGLSTEKILFDSLVFTFRTNSCCSGANGSHPDMVLKKKTWYHIKPIKIRPSMFDSYLNRWVWLCLSPLPRKLPGAGTSYWSPQHRCHCWLQALSIIMGQTWLMEARFISIDYLLSWERGLCFAHDVSSLQCSDKTRFQWWCLIILWRSHWPAPWSHNGMF